MAVERPTVARVTRIMGWVDGDIFADAKWYPDQDMGDHWTVRVANIVYSPFFGTSAEEMIAWARGHGCDRVEVVAKMDVYQRKHEPADAACTG